MYQDYLRNIEDLSTGLGVSEAEGGLGLQGWKETDRAESVNAKGGKEIIGIISENSSVSFFPLLPFGFPCRLGFPRAVRAKYERDNFARL